MLKIIKRHVTPTESQMNEYRLGVKNNSVRRSPKGLRYGSIVVASDADNDG